MDKLYTIQEVAIKLNLSDKTLRRWEEAGRFSPSRTLGNQRRYSIEDLQILDAIKHGTINKQSDLLSLTQASNICGVSPTTIMRWESAGKIHPFITSHNTYYPRTKLVEKMEELKRSYPEPAPEPSMDSFFTSDESAFTEIPEPTHQSVRKLEPEVENKKHFEPKLSQSLMDHNRTWSLDGAWPQFVTNALVTILLILTYHLFIATPTQLKSPEPTSANQGNLSTQTGAVKGVTAPDPRLDILEQKLTDHLSAEMLKDAKPSPVTTINLDNTSVYTGTLTLSKGKDQVVYSNDKITPQTTVTATFTSDYSPAKKFWITPTQGSFTLTTDFPVGSDASINYTFIAPTSTASAVSSPSAVLR